MTAKILTILLPREMPEEAMAQIRALAPRARLLDIAALAEHPERIEEVEISFANVKPEWFARAKRLRWMQTRGAGIEWLLTPAVKASPVIVTNVHIHGEPIAEHLFGLLLMLTRGLHTAYRLQMDSGWGRVERVEVLTGKTLGILGTGAIGVRAAEIGAAFGMHLLGMRRSGGTLPPFEALYTPAQLAEMLPRCDVLILALPLTAETDHFIGAEELAALPPGAIILNIGRGKLIDTDALVAALRAGHLGGAGLDVTDPEPLPADHPLWTLPNVLITPHYAGAYPAYHTDATRVFLDNLRRYLAGEPLLNVVDKARGY